jgi:hypothetical protein
MRQKTSPRSKSMIPAIATVIPKIAGLPETGVCGNGASVGFSAYEDDVGVTVDVAVTQIQFVLSVHDAFLHREPEQIRPD